MFETVLFNINKYVKVSVKYKDTSLFMKILGIILFFNKDFITKYVSTIGNVVYFPSQKYVKTHPVLCSRLLLHEFIHIMDSKKYSSILFSLAYLFPQSLIIFFPLLLLISWKVALISLVVLLPFPAYFRMVFEKRAYLAELYVANKLAKKLKFKYEPERKFIISQFKSSAYYFMWVLPTINKYFDNYTDLDVHPYEDNIFYALDDILDQI